MTDAEFVKLQKDIEKKMLELNRIQRKHIKETGRRFILGQPILMKSKTRLWGEGV